MPSKRLSAALIPVTGGGVKKSGLSSTIGGLNKCTSAGCKVVNK